MVGEVVEFLEEEVLAAEDVVQLDVLGGLAGAQVEGHRGRVVVGGVVGPVGFLVEEGEGLGGGDGDGCVGGGELFDQGVGGGLGEVGVGGVGGDAACEEGPALDGGDDDGSVVEGVDGGAVGGDDFGEGVEGGEEVWVRVSGVGGVGGGVEGGGEEDCEGEGLDGGGFDRGWDEGGGECVGEGAGTEVGVVFVVGCGEDQD